MKHVLFVAAESAPFIKTGGLGSVIGSLPRALNQLDLKVSLVIPGYECILPEYGRKAETLFSFPVKLGWREGMAELAFLRQDDMDVYFIRNDQYYSGPQPYSDIWLDVEKFAFFSKAVLEMLSYLELPVDIIHCHDWQTALLPVYLKSMYIQDPYYARIKTILTIHNLRFQGITEIGHMKDITGLPDYIFSYDMMENYGQANMLKGGINCADRITTVSAAYAEEIKTPEYGEGLFQALAFRSPYLSGITNGIDWHMYDPENDPYLAQTFTVDTFETARRANKLFLQNKTGLKEDPDAFTMGIVSRLTDQKGYDLLEEVLEDVLDEGAQLYVLGEGEEKVEEIFRNYQKKYPDRVYVRNLYQDELAKQIYGACDLTLMPSRFEPCGLNQMMAQRYGCLPLARATGGLKDTIEDDGRLSARGTGFLFDRFDRFAFHNCLKRAFSLYRTHPEYWEGRIRAAMKKDNSWAHAARAYEDLYQSLGE